MNAIILAAGIGSRLGEITTIQPKPLTKVLGKSIIERQIECLHDIGIYDIYIIVGYMSHSFNFLVSKYNVTLIHNLDYLKYNNTFSLFLGKEVFGDTYILEGDIYINNNFLVKSLYKSTVYLGNKSYLQGEGEFEFDKSFRVTNITPVEYSECPSPNKNNIFVPCGVSYWTKKDAQIIIDRLNKTIKEMLILNQNIPKIKSWDILIIELLNIIDLRASIINSKDWFEIDTIYDLEYTEYSIKNL